MLDVRGCPLDHRGFGLVMQIDVFCVLHDIYHVFCLIFLGDLNDIRLIFGIVR